MRGSRWNRQQAEVGGNTVKGWRSREVTHLFYRPSNMGFMY